MIMKKFTLLILSLALILRLSAQVTMIVDSIPDYTPPEDHLFIGGDFNGWNPGDSAFMLHKNDQQKWTLTH